MMHWAFSQLPTLSTVALRKRGRLLDPKLLDDAFDRAIRILAFAGYVDSKRAEDAEASGLLEKF